MIATATRGNEAATATATPATAAAATTEGCQLKQKAIATAATTTL